MSKLTFAIALFLASLLTTVYGAPISLTNSLAMPVVIAELTKEPTLQLEDDKVIRYKLRHQYTLTCGDVRYAVIRYKVDEMYRTNMSLLSGQELTVGKRCSVERGQPMKSYYLKAYE